MLVLTVQALVVKHAIVLVELNVFTGLGGQDELMNRLYTRTNSRVFDEFNEIFEKKPKTD